MLCFVFATRRVPTRLPSVLTDRTDFDAFGTNTANLVFQDPYERIIVGKQYCDIPLGSIYLVRGENVVLMGRIVSFFFEGDATELKRTESGVC